MSLTLDQLRLLHIVHGYTRGHPGSNGRRWMKELHLSVLVYHAIRQRVFSHYDWAPSLVEFHGVKMYGKVSQEAHLDLRAIQGFRLLDKVHLSTCLYDTIRAYRSAVPARGALAQLPEQARVELDRLLFCARCHTLREVLAHVHRTNGGFGEVRTRTTLYCPGCCTEDRRAESGRTITGGGNGTKEDIDFFDIADVKYRCRPILPGGRT